MIDFDAGQRLALNKLSNGKILCGGVGSGKSRVSLAYYFIKECGGSIEPSYSPMTTPKKLYIITTAKKRDNSEWDDEMKLFNLSREDGVVIDSWNNITKYVDVDDAFFIFDEQRLVGSGAWVKAFYQITASGVYSKRVKHNRWILLSATPGDDWLDYIPVFVANKFYRNKTDFVSQHVVYKSRYPYGKPTYLREQELLHLKSKLLVDIPIERKTVRHVHDIIVDHDKAAIQAVMKTRSDPFKDGEPIPDAAQLCLVLRRLVNDNKKRLDEVKRLCFTNDKLIIFYNFDYELFNLRELMDDIGMKYSEWNGHKHQQIPETDRWVYLVQYTAGAEGWNCVETDTIVFYSLNYSYKITEQAMGRIDRRNTPYTDLHYYFLRSTAWIDRAIKKALDNKKNFNERKYQQNLGY